MDKRYEYQNEYKEIDLIDYIQLIVKRKKLILSFLLAGLAIGAFLGFLLPTNYKAETYLEIGIYNKKTIAIPHQLAEEIDAGFYGDCRSIKVNNLKGTNLIRIESVSKNPEKAIKILNDINKPVLEKHNQKIKNQREILEKIIRDLQDRIEFLMQRNKEVAILESQIRDIQIKIQSLQPTIVIKEPIIFSEKKFNLILNLIIGGLLGIFLGIFLASMAKWWSKNKHRIKSVR